jgi:hypothetical protein
MAVYNKFNQFVKDLIDGKHNFSSNTFKVFLTNTQPTANMTAKADMTELSAGSGYSAGGNTVTLAANVASGVAKVTASNTTFTASGGTIGPFQFAVLYNDTASGDPPVAWWDYGAPITLANTEALTIVFDATNGIFTVT